MSEECNHSHEVCKENERKTGIVIILTVITMFAEILYGYITNSMGLLADGFHMGTHALALGLTYVAYVLTRKFENSDLFVNGTDKIGTLAAYTSSIFLGITGIWIIIEAGIRFFHPRNIMFNEAIAVAVIGLLVNWLCICIMETNHCKCKNGKCKNEEKDYNFKAAYYHILADALTSILAIVALLIGKYLNFVCLDPVIGILGGILIIRWAVGLIKDTVKILVDMR